MIRTTTNFFSLICMATFISGCAAHPDPIVDTKGVDMQQYAQDWDECEVYTEQILISQGVVKGAAAGATVGAVDGAIRGKTGERAARGALYGGAVSGLDADEARQRVFKQCLRGRGYKVLN